VPTCPRIVSGVSKESIIGFGSLATKYRFILFLVRVLSVAQ